MSSTLPGSRRETTASAHLDIRDRVKDYSVSIVKGGPDAIGRSAGRVRPPLQNLAPQDLADLKALIATVS